MRLATGTLAKLTSMNSVHTSRLSPSLPRVPSTIVQVGLTPRDPALRAPAIPDQAIHAPAVRDPAMRRPQRCKGQLRLAPALLPAEDAGGPESAQVRRPTAPAAAPADRRLPRTLAEQVLWPTA